MSRIFRLSDTVERDPGIDAWMREGPSALGELARHWFEFMRGRGDDVRETLHDGHPTACVRDAAFAYVNVGFFCGAVLPDPTRLLEGTGKFMRHVKLRPGSEVDGAALAALIDAAYADMKLRLGTQGRT